MPSKRNLKALETRNLDRVELLRPGTWNGDKYTTADMDAMCAAFTALKGRHDPPAKLGHDEKQELLQRDGYPAAGWVERLYREGESLFADVRDVPAKVAELVQAGAYKKRSAEIYLNLKDPNDPKKVYPRVLKAFAFLGADVPAVKGLGDIYAMYADDVETVTLGEIDLEAEGEADLAYGYQPVMAGAQQRQPRIAEQQAYVPGVDVGGVRPRQTGAPRYAQPVQAAPGSVANPLPEQPANYGRNPDGPSTPDPIVNGRPPGEMPQQPVNAGRPPATNKPQPIVNGRPPGVIDQPDMPDVPSDPNVPVDDGPRGPQNGDIWTDGNGRPFIWNDGTTGQEGWTVMPQPRTRQMSEEDEMSELNEIRNLLGLAENDDVKSAVVKLQADQRNLSDQAQVIHTLQTQVKELSDRDADREAEAAVAKGMEAGKILPAVREHYKKLYLSDRETFDALVTHGPKVVDFSRMSSAEQAPVELSEKTRSVAARLGIPEERLADTRSLEEKLEEQRRARGVA